MIDIILEFKTWLEAHDYRCPDKRKHFSRIMAILKKSSYRNELNSSIIQNLKNYVLENIDEKAHKNFFDFAQGNFDYPDFCEIVLSNISYKTTLGRDFLDFCAMEPDEVVNNIYAIVSDMLKNKSVFNKILKLTLEDEKDSFVNNTQNSQSSFLAWKQAGQEEYAKMVFDNQTKSFFKRLIEKTVSRFMINPREMVKGYDPLFKQFFKKNVENDIADWGDVRDSSVENEDEDEELSEQRLFLYSLLEIELKEVIPILKLLITNSIANNCFKIEELIAFKAYIGIKRTPEEFSNLKVCFYTRFLKDAFDKIITNENITDSDLQNYLNDFVNEIKIKHSGLEKDQIEIIKNVASYFYTKTTAQVYPKLLKILFACKASELAKSKNSKLTNIKPFCGLFMGWIKKYFASTGTRYVSEDMSMIKNNKLFNTMSKAIIGKELTGFCQFNKSDDEFEKDVDLI